MRVFCRVVFAVALCGVAVAQVSPSTLQGYVNSDSLVTVVLLKSGVEDPNQRVVEVGPDYVVVQNNSGERNTYLLSDIKEVRPQGGAVAARKVELQEGRVLSPEQKQIVARAFDRATELYGATADNQEIRMGAAALMALNKKQEALTYLQQLVASNDLQTAERARVWLFVIGNNDAGTSVVETGLGSGNRIVRADAAGLAGLLKLNNLQGQLMEMFKDRSPDLSVPATVALARLGVRDIVPDLLSRLTDLEGKKADAAIYGLVRLGGPDVLDGLKGMLDKADQVTKLRVARALYALQDPKGEDLLKNELLTVPSFRREVAMVLARQGNHEGATVLRERLAERFDASEQIYLSRAEMAIALAAGGDRVVVSTLQSLLRTDVASVERYVCSQIGLLGTRSLLTILQPSIESAKPGVALSASQAAIAMGNPDMRERMRQLKMQDLDTLGAEY